MTTPNSQVLTNLLENAARHGPHNSTIRIGGRERGECTGVWVDDEGIGVVPHDRRRMVEPFRPVGYRLVDPPRTE